MPVGFSRFGLLRLLVSGKDPRAIDLFRVHPTTRLNSLDPALRNHNTQEPRDIGYTTGCQVAVVDDTTVSIDLGRRALQKRRQGPRTKTQPRHRALRPGVRA